MLIEWLNSEDLQMGIWVVAKVLFKMTATCTLLLSDEILDIKDHDDNKESYGRSNLAQE